jgi:Abortive infection alpha
LIESRIEQGMGDEKLPYEEAITESAKAASNAIDLVREGGRAIGDIYSVLIGDRVSAAREWRLDKITRETKQILRDRDLKDQQEVPENIAVPLLEAAQRESRDDLQTLWARLLANAMDPSRSESVRPEFINLIQKLEPPDARVLEYLRTKPRDLNVNKFEAYSALGCRQTAAVVSLDHLAELRCIRFVGQGHVLALTELGAELMVAVEA